MNVVDMLLQDPVEIWGSSVPCVNKYFICAGVAQVLRRSLRRSKYFAQVIAAGGCAGYGQDLRKLCAGGAPTCATPCATTCAKYLDLRNDLRNNLRDLRNLLFEMIICM